MVIRTMPTSDLQPASYNPRLDLQPGDPAYEALRSSIERWGLVEPLIVNERTGRLVSGHQRLKVLRAKGVAEVEVSVVDLDEPDEKALNVAINKIEGGWDEEKLAELLSSLEDESPDLLPLTGFTDVDISNLFSSLDIRPDSDPNSSTKPDADSDAFHGSTPDLTAPFPWFGGKRRVAEIVWKRFGEVKNYVEPFAGSLAVLLGRPDWQPGMIETVNDKDASVCNFWRAVAADPNEVAKHATYPVNESDLHARHFWLVDQKKDLVSRLEGDPDYYDPKIAGYWVWGINLWIGGEWCHGSNGPWSVVDGRLVKGEPGSGVKRQRPNLAAGARLNLERVQNFSRLQDRLRDVRICCGDWNRICTKTPTYSIGLTAVFLDPPYSDIDRYACYSEESFDVAHSVRDWCIENGSNPLLRIALCGYVGEHEQLEKAGWDVLVWSASGGYSGMAHEENLNRHRERIWFSPHCLPDGETRSRPKPRAKTGRR